MGDWEVVVVLYGDAEDVVDVDEDVVVTVEEGKVVVNCGVKVDGLVVGVVNEGEAIEVVVVDNLVVVVVVVVVDLLVVVGMSTAFTQDFWITLFIISLSLTKSLEKK